MLQSIIKFMLIVGCTVAAETDTKQMEVMLPLCERSNPELNDCIKNATNLLKDKFSTGIPELKLGSLEPLNIPSIRLEQTTKSSSFKAVLMDCMIHGLSKYEFTDVDVNLENVTFYGKIHFEHLYLDSEYMLMGEFQMLPVEGSGQMMVNFTDVSVDLKLRGGLLKRKDEFYFMNHETNVQVEVVKSESKFENLYSGSDEKSHINEHLINMHSSEILDELKPALETIVSMLFDDIANKFFRHIPFDKLLPN